MRQETTALLQIFRTHGNFFSKSIKICQRYRLVLLRQKFMVTCFWQSVCESWSVASRDCSQ